MDQKTNTCFPIEIIVAGTGGGYGESILLKLESNYWIVVDCCVNIETKTPIPIEYFEENKIDYVNDVKKIICTHWHDDHINAFLE